MKNKSGQISIEYMIIIGFVTVLVIGMLGAGYFYTNAIKDKLKFNQINSFAEKIISSAEAIFQSGSPSKTTINAYLPAGVKNIIIQENQIQFTISTNSGQNTLSYTSQVPLSGTLSTSEGLKKILISAEQDSASIYEN
jgi:uncharacterized protein (UPF0333 family)